MRAYVRQHHSACLSPRTSNRRARSTQPRGSRRKDPVTSRAGSIQARGSRRKDSFRARACLASTHHKSICSATTGGLSKRAGGEHPSDELLHRRVEHLHLRR